MINSLRLCRFGGTTFSDWKNMPSKLILKSQLSIQSHNYYQVSAFDSIPGFDETVYFDPQNCSVSSEQDQ